MLRVDPCYLLVVGAKIKVDRKHVAETAIFRIVNDQTVRRHRLGELHVHRHETLVGRHGPGVIARVVRRKTIAFRMRDPGRNVAGNVGIDDVKRCVGAGKSKTACNHPARPCAAAFDGQRRHALVANGPRTMLNVRTGTAEPLRLRAADGRRNLKRQIGQPVAKVRQLQRFKNDICMPAIGGDLIAAKKRLHQRIGILRRATRVNRSAANDPFFPYAVLINHLAIGPNRFDAADNAGRQRNRAVQAVGIGCPRTAENAADRAALPAAGLAFMAGFDKIRNPDDVSGHTNAPEDDGNTGAIARILNVQAFKARSVLDRT